MTTRPTRMPTAKEREALADLRRTIPRVARMTKAEAAEDRTRGAARRRVAQTPTPRGYRRRTTDTAGRPGTVDYRDGDETMARPRDTKTDFEAQTGFNYVGDLTDRKCDGCDVGTLGIEVKETDHSLHCSFCEGHVRVSLWCKGDRATGCFPCGFRMTVPEHLVGPYVEAARSAVAMQVADATYDAGPR